MRAVLIAAVVILGWSVNAEAQTCQTVQPGPTWVCVNGGWLPPGHPAIPTTATPTPAPAPPTTSVPLPKVAFKLGSRYTRGTADVRIVGSGQIQGAPVLFAYCNEVGDGCFFQGFIRTFPAYAEAQDWTDYGPY